MSDIHDLLNQMEHQRDTLSDAIGLIRNNLGLPEKGPHTPTAYNTFISQLMRDGYTMQESAQIWKKKQAQTEDVPVKIPKIRHLVPSVG